MNIDTTKLISKVSCMLSLELMKTDTYFKTLVIVSGYNLRCYDALVFFLVSFLLLSFYRFRASPFTFRMVYESFKHFNSHFVRFFLIFKCLKYKKLLPFRDN
ncbi:hypothetical protein BD560DRAFT_493855 [Blakeslea trispora]|nr:hypothetical protein BD560DRAFT_493855 [Blakeslea trispora]